MTGRTKVAKVHRQNKFRAKPTLVDGIRFDSRKEARRYQELRLLERAGEIKDLKLQEAIFLQGQKGPLLTRTGRKMRLTVDFFYTCAATGDPVYEDTKGVRTKDYEVRKAVVEAMGYKIKET